MERWLAHQRRNGILQHRIVCAFLVLVIFPLALAYRGTVGLAPDATELERQPIQTLETPGESDAEHDAPDVQFSIDRVNVDYVYISELITPIYQMYGSYLDDFVIVMVDNQHPLPVRVIVESEIFGYTARTIDTVEVGAEEKIEVR